MASAKAAAIAGAAGGFALACYYSVRLWRVQWRLRRRWRTLLRAPSHDSFVALRDNQHALSARWGVKLFNVNDGAVLRTFRNHTREVHSLALMPDGLRFVSGSADNTACIVEHGLAPVSA